MTDTPEMTLTQLSGEVELPHYDANGELHAVIVLDAQELRACLAAAIAREAALVAEVARLERVVNAASEMRSRQVSKAAELRWLEKAVRICEQERLTAQLSGLETGWEHPNTQTAWQLVLKSTALSPAAPRVDDGGEVTP